MTHPRPAGAARPGVNRRRRQALLAAALLLQLLFSNSNCFAQEPTPTPVEDEEVVSVRTDLVVVPVFVTDGHGRRVSGLTQAEFQVRDNGRSVVTSYSAAGAESVALLSRLDAWGSTRETITQQRERALALFPHFGARS